MSDKDYYESITIMLSKSLSSVEKIKFNPHKAGAVKALKQLLEKTKELRGL